MPETITFRINDSLADGIGACARINDRSVSAEIREALRAHVAQTRLDLQNDGDPDGQVRGRVASRTRGESAGVEV